MNNGGHERFMEVCLRLAERGRGHVSPNPLVGAVLVKRKQIVAQGFHRRFGEAHAEAECLRSYSGNPVSTTLYVNLEPCTHYGKTPPCADLIIKSGIKKVVVGMKDPNPRVNGRGIRKLRASGIRVMMGVLESRARTLNRAFITYMTKRRPLVHVKIAQSLDGKIAQDPNTRTKLTGEESQRLVHKMRSEHDAILVGAGTVRVDNPSLTVRLVKGRDPAVVVIDGRLSLETERKLWRTARRRRVFLFSSLRAVRKQTRKVREFTSYGVDVVPIESDGYHLPLRRILKALYQRRIASIFVEAGTDLVGQFISEGPVDILSVFIAPKVFGSGIMAFVCGSRRERAVPRWRVDVDPLVRKLGHDVLLQYSFDGAI